MKPHGSFGPCRSNGSTTKHYNSFDIVMHYYTGQMTLCQCNQRASRWRTTVGGVTVIAALIFKMQSAAYAKICHTWQKAVCQASQLLSESFLQSNDLSGRVWKIATDEARRPWPCTVEIEPYRWRTKKRSGATCLEKKITVFVFCASVMERTIHLRMSLSWWMLGWNNLYGTHWGNVRLHISC